MLIALEDLNPRYLSKEDTARIEAALQKIQNIEEAQ